MKVGGLVPNRSPYIKKSLILANFTPPLALDSLGMYLCFLCGFQRFRVFGFGGLCV